MSILTRPPRCEECGASLANAPPNHHTLALENLELRTKVATLEREVGFLSNGGFISSETARHFHRADCKWALEIPRRSQTVYLGHDDAVAAGKLPCKTCCS
jgi:hypothetical protein